MLDHLGVEDAEDVFGVQSNVLAFKARHSNLDHPTLRLQRIPFLI
jgi:hypothetical protein